MRKLIALGSAALIAAVALAACGSSSKPASGSTTTTVASGSTGSGTSSDAFLQLVANADKQKFKITYTAGNSGDSLIYEQDGKGDSVSRSGSSQYFTTPNSAISCSTDNGKANCTEVQSAGSAITSPFLSLFNTGKTYIDALGGHGDTSSKSIVGRHASCITFSAKDLGGLGGAAAAAFGAKGSATYCVDKSTGVLLEISGTDASGAATHGFEVTKYEEPSDSDFTPPATPKTIPSYSIPTVSLPPGVTMPTIPNSGPPQ